MRSLLLARDGQRPHRSQPRHGRWRPGARCAARPCDHVGNRRRSIPECRMPDSDDDHDRFRKLAVRVHKTILEGERLPPNALQGDIWKRRFRHINDWEAYLADQGTRIVKLFLNVSKAEQKKRFLSRIDEPDKNWKFNAGDVRER